MTKRTSAELAARSLRQRIPGRAPSGAPAIAIAPLEWRTRSELITSVGLFAADAVAFGLCALFFLAGSLDTSAIWIAAAVWFVLRALAGLYESIAMAPPEELRRAVMSTATALVAQLAMLYLLGQLRVLWPAALAMWGGLLAVQWLTRRAVRLLLMRLGRYGAPVIVVGAGETAAALIDELQVNRDQGLQPVAIFDNDHSLRGSQVRGVPVVGSIEDAIEFHFPYRVEHALIALDPEDARHLRRLSDRFAARFAHVHVTPEFVGLANLWVRARSIGPLLTFEFRQDRLTPFTFAFKRGFDLAIGAVLFVIAVPVIAVCAILVKFRSPGPAFFSHVREGHGGKWIRVWKIRTMVPDAEERLEEHLRHNSDARREWAERVKLYPDPRVIPGLGDFMRRWSLDELPQLWNVVAGSMSLVGPRPFPEYHLSMFPVSFRDLRRQVPPGVTGLWQVTYRTDGDLTHQQAADSYYVHNWSVWLDLWILLRTVRVVFSGSGV